MGAAQSELEEVAIKKVDTVEGGEKLRLLEITLEKSATFKTGDIVEILGIEDAPRVLGKVRNNKYSRLSTNTAGGLNTIFTLQLKDEHLYTYLPFFQHTKVRIVRRYNVFRHIQGIKVPKKEEKEDVEEEEKEDVEEDLPADMRFYIPPNIQLAPQVAPVENINAELLLQFVQNPNNVYRSFTWASVDDNGCMLAIRNTNIGAGHNGVGNNENFVFDTLQNGEFSVNDVLTDGSTDYRVTEVDDDQKKVHWTSLAVLPKNVVGYYSKINQHITTKTAPPPWRASAWDAKQWNADADCLQFLVAKNHNPTNVWKMRFPIANYSPVLVFPAIDVHDECRIKPYDLYWLTWWLRTAEPVHHYVVCEVYLKRSEGVGHANVVVIDRRIFKNQVSTVLFEPHGKSKHPRKREIKQRVIEGIKKQMNLVMNNPFPSEFGNQREMPSKINVMNAEHATTTFTGVQGQDPLCLVVRVCCAEHRANHGTTHGP